MYAMELSGVHVAKRVKITYRMKSWPAYRKAETLDGWLARVKHEPGGEAWITVVPASNLVSRGRSYTAVRIPFDAEVEIGE